MRVSAFSRAIKKDVCKKLNIHETNWSKYIKKLIDKNIIADKGFNRYNINPLMFWKGDTKERVDAIMDYQILFIRTPVLKNNMEIKQNNSVTKEAK